ncbi:stress response protein NST1 [Contarinia nasturtii]|uniref:stress response protein NST1 n=1 Tax=Contarinia nasturtii TaxID=265458 RepID=UPI0012D44480|nr:stress response protein NST1 [Contarinia nasturtii]
MNYICELRTLLRHAMRFQPNRLSVANYSKSVEPKDDEVYDEDNDGKLSVSDVLQDDVDLTEREQQIELMRNKSRLNTTHRNIVFNMPSLGEQKWDKTLDYSRKQFGRFGSKSGVDPRLCFYSPEEAADKAEYERVAYPYTIQEIIAANKKAKADKMAKRREREDKIAQNLTKLDKWMVELKQRVAQKEKAAIEAKKKREQVLEDIRQEFGFKIDQKDPRFQALMERKELEEKKAKKAAKKAKKEEYTRKKLLMATEKAKETDQKSDTVESDTVNEADEEEVAAKSEDLPKKKAKKGKDKDSSSSSDSESDDEDNNKKKK